MGYAIYSEVYLARRTSKELKIGETNNSSRRSHQLSYKHGYTIYQSYDVAQEKTSITQDESIRKFIEAGLRVILDNCGSAHRIGNDFFDCDDEATSDYIQENFEEWVNDLEKLAKKVSKWY